MRIPGASMLWICASCAVLAAAALTNSEVLEDLSNQFRIGGSVLTRSLLEPTEVSRLAVRLRELLSEHGRRAFGDDGTKEVRFTFAVHELDKDVAKFVARRSSRLWQEAERLAGSKNLCVLMDRGFSKDPGDPETHWHRDDEAIGLHRVHAGLRTVHAWIPLAAMNKDMGTLQYLVGTHRRSYGWLENLITAVWGWDVAWFATARTIQDDGLELGDVAWHDGWTLHSAGSNSAQAVRDGLAVSYAYCIDSDGCGGAAAHVSASDPSCRATESLFDKGWRERHRNGENDYSKTLLTDPWMDQ
ncbi:unnamed protein product, partial [Polarella glacialis]